MISSPRLTSGCWQSLGEIGNKVGAALKTSLWLLWCPASCHILVCKCLQTSQLVVVKLKNATYTRNREPLPLQKKLCHINVSDSVHFKSHCEKCTACKRCCSVTSTSTCHFNYAQHYSKYTSVCCRRGPITYMTHSTECNITIWDCFVIQTSNSIHLKNLW